MADTALDAEAIIRILEGMPESARDTWLKSIRFTDDTGDLLPEFTTVIDHFRDSGDKETLRLLIDHKDKAIGRVDSRIVKEANDEINAGGQIGTVSAQAQAAAEEAGSDPDHLVLDPTNIPMEVLQLTGGADASEESAALLLEEWNLRFNNDWETLQDAVDDGVLDSAVAAQIARVTITEPDPKEAFQIKLYSGQDFTVSAPQWEEAEAVYGYDQEMMTRIVRYADTADLRYADGEGVAWQPLAAVMAANGTDERLWQESANSEYMEIGREIRELEQRAIDSPSTWEGLQPEIARLKKKQKDMGYTPFAQGTPVLNFASSADAYQQGLDLYDYDVGVAFIHSQDPVLAAKIKASNGDPTLLSGVDRAEIARHIGNAGYQTGEQFVGSLLSQGYAEADNSAGLIANYMATLKTLQDRLAGGGGRTRVLPDPAAVRQSAKDFYQALFLEEPDEATLGQFSAEIMATIAAAPDDQNVDIDAQVRKIAEKMPQYDKYYGNKPAGMQDAEFQGMHRAAQSSMLGDELAGNQSVRIGMQQGDYQTTVGASMGTAEAWDNSTFLGRLARASQIVGRNT